MSVHLCQPDGEKSCGVCCGMFNVSGATMDEIRALLNQRTIRFHEDCAQRTPAQLDAFRLSQLEVELPRKLLSLLRNCPFLGFIDREGGRVGCLLHPACNQGVDYRDHGVYDADVCENYLCAAFSSLTAEERSLILSASGDDSLLYSLVLNDRAFLRGLFNGVAKINGAYPTGKRLFKPATLKAVKDFFSLKADWPFRDPESGVIGAYLPDGAEDVVPRTIDYQSLGVKGSEFNAILCALGSRFDDLDELREAEALIYGAIYDVALAYERT